MGQEQSSPIAQTASNRLSKPRTNNSVTNLLTSKSLVQLNGQYSRRNSSKNVVPASHRPSMETVDTAAREITKPKETSQKKRRMAFMRKSSQEPEEPMLDFGIERNFVEPMAVDSPQHRRPLKERSSTTSLIHDGTADQSSAPPERPPNRSRMSLPHVPYALHHKRLSFVTEALSPRLDSLSSKRNSQYAGVDPPLPSRGLHTRTSSDTDLYAPMRRRSLLQHGVATRRVLRDNTPPPLPIPIRSGEKKDSHYLQPSVPVSSAFNNIAAISQMEPRVVTPNALDYGHIGAFKLGSLRITNGPASPSPSVDLLSYMGAEDHNTTSNGHQSNESHPDSIGSHLPTLLVTADAQKSRWDIHAESIIRKSSNIAELTVDTKIATRDSSLARITPGNTSKNVASPTRSDGPVDEYMADSALSPFSFVPSRSPSQPGSPVPGFEVTSKHTAFEDELFIAEPSTPRLSYTPASSDSGYGAGPKSIIGPSNANPKPLAKADSGYSSNVSLRSFKASLSKKDLPALPSNEAPLPPSKEPVSVVASSRYSFESVRAGVTFGSSYAQPARPVEAEIAPPPPVRDAPPLPLKNTNIYSSVKEVLPPLPPTKTSEQIFSGRRRSRAVIQQQKIRQASLSAVTSQATRYQRSASDSSTSSAGSSIWRPNKKGKQRAQSVEQIVRISDALYTVQASPQNSFHIPAVPAAASRSLEERVDAFPLNCFPNTMSSGPRKTSSKETLRTIFSVGSEFTDLPVGREELTRSRLQSALPSLPAPERRTLQVRHSHQGLSSQLSRPYGLQKTIVQPDLADHGHRGPRRMSEDYLQLRMNEKKLELQVEANVATKLAFAKEKRVPGEVLARTTSSPIVSHPASLSSHPVPLRFQRNSRTGVATIQIQGPTLTDGRDQAEVQRLSFLARERQPKSPPPVSMHNQHTFAPSLYGSRDLARAPQISPLALSPTELLQDMLDHPPILPAHIPSRPRDNKQQEHGLRLKQEDSWVSQRKVAIEAPRIKPVKSMDAVNMRKTLALVRDRKSMDSMSSRNAEERRPPSAHRNGDLRTKTSSDFAKATPRLDVLGPDSARPGYRQNIARNDQSQEYRSKVEARQDFGHTKWDPTFMHKYEPHTQNPAFDRNGEYNHTYGHQSSSMTQNRALFLDNQYYDGPAHVYEYDNQAHKQRFERSLHRSHHSTSDMLVFDHYPGGLDYGYGPTSRVGGSVGTRYPRGNVPAGAGRRSLDNSMDGVDFSDVPLLPRAGFHAA